MSGKIFQKPNGVTHYYDHLDVGDYSFDAGLDVQEKRGDPLAIRCGRIIYFELLCEEEVVALFNDGYWIVDPTNYENGFDFEEARLAMDILISKWSNPDRIRDPSEMLKKKRIEDKWGKKLGDIYYR